MYSPGFFFFVRAPKTNSLESSGKVGPYMHFKIHFLVHLSKILEYQLSYIIGFEALHGMPFLFEKSVKSFCKVLIVVMPLDSLLRGVNLHETFHNFVYLQILD